MNKTHHIKYFLKYFIEISELLQSLPSRYAANPTCRLWLFRLLGTPCSPQREKSRHCIVSFLCEEFDQELKGKYERAKIGHLDETSLSFFKECQSLLKEKYNKEISELEKSLEYYEQKKRTKKAYMKMLILRNALQAHRNALDASLKSFQYTPKRNVL